MKFLKKSAEYRYVRMVMRRYEKHLPRWGLLAVAVGKLVLVAYLALRITPALATDKAANEAYARVEKTHMLRCAYTVYPPYFTKDPNTGAFGGFSYEFFEAIAKQLSLKIEWAEEVNPNTLLEGFKTNRYDAVCLGYAETPGRAWGGDFTKPFMFWPFYMYVRADETRFKTIDDFNKKGVTLASQDGEMSQMVAREDFPLATEKAMPDITQPSERLMMVATGKADGTGMEPDIATEFMQKNPGKIKRFSDTPLRMQGGTIVIPHDEEKLKSLLNAAIDTMLWTGAEERLIKKYEKTPGSMVMPSPAYTLPEVKK
jgi:ABC-type amino acid transport substrate-binding protein